MIEYFLMAFLSGAPTAPPVQPGVQPAVAQAGVPTQPVPVAAQKAEPKPKQREFKNPININADRFEIQGKRREAVWSGNVTAVRGGTKLTCDRLVAFYTSNQEITRIECAGNVEVHDGNKRAKGERADFDNVTGILVVTGTPQARQGGTLMEGTKVTFNVARDLMVVDNAKIVFESLPTRTSKKAGAKKGQR